MKNSNGFKGVITLSANISIRFDACNNIDASVNADADTDADARCGLSLILFCSPTLNLTAYSEIFFDLDKWYPPKIDLFEVRNRSLS